MTYNVFSRTLNPTQSLSQSYVIKIQIGLTYLLSAYPGCPGKEAVKRVSVYTQG